MGKTVDICGTRCPLVVYNIGKEIKKLNSGEVLEVLVNDPAAEKDVPAWSRVTGHELLEVKKNNGTIRFVIRKK
jgi:tRNA 2-thiouridine synthesizing protein A